MDDAERLFACHPIASAGTEATCGLTIKDRMCYRGMHWSLRTAPGIITLRSIIKITRDGWQTFWKQAFITRSN